MTLKLTLTPTLIPPNLQQDSNKPIYMEIYYFYKREILNGRFTPRAKLPSIRQLALHLGVSRNPVEVGYAQLVAEGYIVNQVKRGYFAAELEPLVLWVGREKTQKINDDEPTSKREVEELRDVSAQLSESISFEYDQMDMEHFPLALWRKMTLKVLQPSSRDLFTYGNRKGEQRLRVLIADHLQQNRGVRCDPEQIIMTAGSQQSAVILSGLLQKEHRTLAVEAAMHPGMYDVFRHHQLDMIPLSLDSDGLSIHELDAHDAIRAVYVTPSHQFPYGMIMSATKRVKLLQWAAKKKGFIIEDDYDSDFLYEGRPVPALQGMDNTGSVVYLGTFSKSLAPALRLSYIILPPVLLQRFEHEFPFYDQTASRLIQKTMELLMEQGHYERHVRRMRKVYRQKRDMLIQAVEQYFGEHATLSGTSSGLHVILKVESGLTTQDLVDKAYERGVIVQPIVQYHVTHGVHFDNKMDSTNNFLLGFGGLSAKATNEGIKRLAQAWLP